MRLKPKERRQSINNLASWMLAWNHFMQAILHFWPRMFYKLFTYQKNFCRLTTKYKFDACYTYDRDFRLLQASQTSMKPEQRTAKWETVHPELTNMHLQADSMLPVCFHCRSTGHYATTAHQKQSVQDPMGKLVICFGMQLLTYIKHSGPQPQHCLPSNQPGIQSTAMHSQEDHAVDLTGEYFVQNRHANFHTHMQQMQPRSSRESMLVHH